MTSRTPTPAETVWFPWEREDDSDMYGIFELSDDMMSLEFGDFDTPEQNSRAREIVRKREGESK